MCTITGIHNGWTVKMQTISIVFQMICKSVVSQLNVVFLI